MSQVPTAELLQLPLNEKLSLIQLLWESVAASRDPYPISEREKKLIDERLEAHRRDPEAVSTWPEVKARLLKRR